MSIEVLHSLFNQKNLSSAFDLIQKFGFTIFDGSDLYVAQAIFSRILFQRGDLDKLDTLLKEIISELSLTDYSNQFTFYTLLGIVNFEMKRIEKGIHNHLKTIELLQFYTQKIADSEILRLNKFLHGLYLESTGSYKEAKWKFLESLEGTILIENNFINYHLGLVYRYLGQLDESFTYFIKVVDLSFAMVNNELGANSNNFIGEISLIKGDFQTAALYLQLAMEQWNELKSNYGLSWAIYDLYVLEFLQGNYSIALENLLKLYELTENELHDIPRSDMLLQIAIMSHLCSNYLLSNDYNDILQGLDPSGKYEIISVRQTLGLGVIALKATRISRKFSQVDALDNVSSKFITEKITSLVLFLKYLTMELEITKSEVVKDNIVNQQLQANQKLLEYLVNPRSLTIFLLSRQIDSLLGEVFEKVVSASGFHFSLDKDIMTPARMSILLQLIGRKNLSFSNLKKETQLSSGNISSVVKTLVDKRLIKASKMVIDNRFVTTYNLTAIGLMKLENYANYLKSKFSSDED